jgi:hypothetical protein
MNVTLFFVWSFTVFAGLKFSYVKIITSLQPTEGISFMHVLLYEEWLKVIGIVV